MIRSIMTVFLLLLVCSMQAQSYQEIDTVDTVEREAFLEKYNEKNKAFIKQLKRQYRGKTGRLMAERFESFYESFAKEIDRGSFIFNSPFNDFVESLVKEIQSNYEDIEDFDVLISRETTANAYCLANGTLVLNIGLFYWLENEDQIAGVLAHEIAHNQLEHSVNRQHQQIERELSKDYKAEIKNLRRTQYNQGSKAFNLFKEQMYESRRESRIKELEADSMAVAILKNTRFHREQYVKALQLISQHDSIRPIGLQDSIYRKLFNLPNMAFKEAWLKIEDFSNYNYELYQEKLHLDSIASHPDLIERMERVSPTGSFSIDSIASKKPSEAFKDLSYIANFERVPSLYALELYGVGIYLSLYELQKGTDEEFYKKWLGNFFQKIYEARKSYTLNRYLDQVDPKNHSKSYQKFLGFMWNLKLDEIEQIAAYYAKD